MFLWVFVVVKSPLAGVRHDDRISDLHKRLNCLPRSCSSCTRDIIGRWGPFYAEDAAQYFQLKLVSEVEVLAIELSFVDEDEDDLQPGNHLRWLSEATYKARLETLCCRLNSRCLGLLEADFSSHRVEYLHRTVADYVEKPNVQWRLRMAAGSFDFHVRLCSSSLAGIKTRVSPYETSRMSQGLREGT